MHTRKSWLSNSQSYPTSDLSRYYTEEPLIRETADQVIKDFGLFDMLVRFSGDNGTPYNELYEQLLPYIEDLMMSDNARLNALLYQIDVPESFWNKIRKEAGSESVAHCITDAILQRELLKVVTRNHFRKGRLGKSEY